MTDDDTAQMVLEVLRRISDRLDEIGTWTAPAEPPAPRRRVGSHAWCPLCHRKTGVFRHRGRRIFEHHFETRTDVCDASGWLVEDHELVGGACDAR